MSTHTDSRSNRWFCRVAFIVAIVVMCAGRVPTASAIVIRVNVYPGNHQSFEQNHTTTTDVDDGNDRGNGNGNDGLRFVVDYGRFMNVSALVEDDSNAIDGDAVVLVSAAKVGTGSDEVIRGEPIRDILGYGKRSSAFKRRFGGVVRYSPNANGDDEVLEYVERLSSNRVEVFAESTCLIGKRDMDGGFESGDVKRDVVSEYLKARAEGKSGRAVVVTCEDAEGRLEDALEAFAKRLDAVEGAGVRALGVFYSINHRDDGDGDVEQRAAAMGRALLALEDADEVECGLMCETQVQLVTGIVIFWGILLTLLYGWGLMTDLDTPQYWATPDENDKKD